MMINFPKYEFGQTQENKTTKKDQDSSPLVLLGLGILAGYLLFSKNKEEDKDEKPLDGLDKAIANKIEIHGNPNILVGGRGDHLTPQDVDPSEYKKGLKVEMEHTTNKDIASEIALDHLAEDDNYYTKLEKIHKENPDHPRRKYVFNEEIFSNLYDKYDGDHSKIAYDIFKGHWSVDYKAMLKIYLNRDGADWKHKYPNKNARFVSREQKSKLKDENLKHDFIYNRFVKENPIKDPKGGLTAEGRRYFKETEGANLKAGVMKVETLEDLKRWGSWARRFYGRSVLPPLKDEKGEPTRLALDAQAWGCKIPKTKKEAKVIAKRGSEALKLYKELKKQGKKKNDSVSFRICN